jgi:hypothetical protein
MTPISHTVVRGRPDRVRELRALVTADAYCVDPARVAEAVLQRMPTVALSARGARSPQGVVRLRGDH